jgi:hypothetical protein
MLIRSCLRLSQRAVCKRASMLLLLLLLWVQAFQPRSLHKTPTTTARPTRLLLLLGQTNRIPQVLQLLPLVRGAGAAAGVGGCCGSSQAVLFTL